MLDGRLLCYQQLSECTDIRVLFLGVQNRKRTRTRRSHNDTSPLKDASALRLAVAKGSIEPSSLHTFWRELKHLRHRNFGGVPEEPVMFWAVRQSRLLILAPLSNPGIKSRIREKIPGGQHFLTITVRFKLDFKLAWHEVQATGPCVGLLGASICFKIALPLHNTTQTRPKHKEAETENLTTLIY